MLLHLFLQSYWILSCRWLNAYERSILYWSPCFFKPIEQSYFYWAFRKKRQIRLKHSIDFNSLLKFFRQCGFNRVAGICKKSHNICLMYSFCSGICARGAVKKDIEKGVKNTCGFCQTARAAAVFEHFSLFAIHIHSVWSIRNASIRND